MFGPRRGAAEPGAVAPTSLATPVTDSLHPPVGRFWSWAPSKSAAPVAGKGDQLGGMGEAIG